MTNNLSFYLFYKLSAEVFEEGTKLDLYSEKEFLGIFVLLKNVYRILRMNSIHILRNTPGSLFDVWDVDHTLCSKLNFSSQEKDIFVEYLANCCKADVYDGLSSFFSYLMYVKQLVYDSLTNETDYKTNGEEQELRFFSSEEQNQFAKRFGFCMKFGFMNIISLKDLETSIDQTGKQSLDSVLSNIKNKMTDSTKNLKRLKEAQIFTEPEIKMLENLYKNAIKLSLQLHTAAKNKNLGACKVRVILHDELLTLEIK